MEPISVLIGAILAAFGGWRIGRWWVAERQPFAVVVGVTFGFVEAVHWLVDLFQIAGGVQ